MSAERSMRRGEATEPPDDLRRASMASACAAARPLGRARTQASTAGCSPRLSCSGPTSLKVRPGMHASAASGTPRPSETDCPTRAREEAQTTAMSGWPAMSFRSSRPTKPRAPRRPTRTGREAAFLAAAALGAEDGPAEPEEEEEEDGAPEEGEEVTEMGPVVDPDVPLARSTAATTAGMPSALTPYHMAVRGPESLALPDA
jgi:hypothetical protein